MRGANRTGGEKNATETDVDCGATCPTCADGKVCSAKEDCTSGKCEGGLCKSLAGTCASGKKDGDETDVDCGGSCGGCGFADGCVVPADCTSGLCQESKCTAPATCNDATLTPGETDVDCGGSDCPGCGLGKGCKGHIDCLSIACVLGVCKEPACDDVSANGNETDVDCGGKDCGPCGDGLKCKAGPDCAGGNCTGGFCGSCTDKKKNGNETDVDCGGACDPCETGKACGEPTDCQSENCGGGVCVSCSDKALNGNETDVDCGGGCGPCADGKKCDEDVDCSGGACGGGTCCKANACGQCGAVPEEVCNGKDDDCNGEDDDGLAATLCDNQKGVCSGSKATCNGTQGWVCEAATVDAIAGYEATETACDKLDNDCDGQTDEDGCSLCGAKVSLDQALEADYFDKFEVSNEFFALDGDVPTAAFSAYNSNSFGRTSYLSTAGLNIQSIDADVVNGPTLAYTGTDLVGAYRKDLGSLNQVVVGKLGFTTDEWYSRSTDIPDGQHETVLAIGGGKQLVVYVDANYDMWFALADEVGDFQTWEETQLDTEFDSGVAAKLDSDGNAYFVWRYGGGGDLVIRDQTATSPAVITTAKVGVPDMAIGADKQLHVAYQVPASKKVFLFSGAYSDMLSTPLEVAANVTSQYVAVAVGTDNVPYVAYVVESNKVNVVKVVDGKVIQVSKKALGTQASDSIARLEIEVVEKGVVYVAAFLDRLNTSTFAFTTTCQGYDGTTTCTKNCSGKVCGDDGCGGTCGTCSGGKSCSGAGQCVTNCTPNCTGKVCGDDGCGGECGSCSAGKTCSAAGLCESSGAVCGANAASTCGGKCGGQGTGGCYCDTQCETSGDCCPDYKACCAACVPSCSGKVCGNDGCGGSCGTCSAGKSCNASGQCAAGGVDKFGLPAGCLLQAEASTCNPLTNLECTGGAACDLGNDGATTCYPPPNTAGPGAACSNSTGPYCQGGYHCDASLKCRKFCCSSTDCGGKACTALALESYGTIGTCAP